MAVFRIFSSGNRWYVSDRRSARIYYAGNQRTDAEALTVTLDGLYWREVAAIA